VRPYLRHAARRNSPHIAADGGMRSGWKVPGRNRSLALDARVMARLAAPARRDFTVLVFDLEDGHSSSPIPSGCRSARGNAPPDREVPRRSARWAPGLTCIWRRMSPTCRGCAAAHRPKASGDSGQGIARRMRPPLSSATTPSGTMRRSSRCSLCGGPIRLIGGGNSSRQTLFVARILMIALARLEAGFVLCSHRSAICGYYGSPVPRFLSAGGDCEPSYPSFFWPPPKGPRKERGNYLSGPGFHRPSRRKRKRDPPPKREKRKPPPRPPPNPPLFKFLAKIRKQSPIRG